MTDNAKSLFFKTLAETATTAQVTTTNVLVGTFDLSLLMSFVGTIVAH